MTKEDRKQIESHWKDHWKFDVPGFFNLLAIHLKVRSQLYDKWKRGLPFGDELFDRWEKAAFLGFGTGTSIYDSSMVLGEVEVGENTQLLFIYLCTLK